MFVVGFGSAVGGGGREDGEGDGFVIWASGVVGSEGFGGGGREGFG